MEPYFEKAIFCYCHIGGEIIFCDDKSIKYEGGLIDGFPIDQNVMYDQFVQKACRVLGVPESHLSLKYSIQADKTRLLPLNGQDALSNLLMFNEGIADVYAFGEYDPTKSMRKRPRSSNSQTPITNVSNAHQNMTQSMPLVSTLWESVIQEEGQFFDSANAFRDALHKFSLANRFLFKYVKNDASYIRAKCDVADCPWKVTVGQIGKSGIYMVKKFIREHKHSAQDQMRMKISVLARFIGSIVQGKIKSSPDYLPTQIVSDLSRDFTMNISYKQAWRGKEKAKEAIDGAVIDSYKLVPWMCERLENSNPGTVALYTSDEEQRFHQLFIAYHACLHGFRTGCRRLLFIDGTFLKGPFLGFMLGATALDANDGMYPVAFGIVKSESVENWLWFLKNLKATMNDNREIVIVSDRSQSIISAVRQVYSSDIHAHCFRHLKENFFKYLGQFHLSTSRKRTLESLLDVIAYTYNVDVCEKALSRLKELCGDAHDWIVKSDLKHWANSQFPKRRYGKFNSNLAETFNGWVLKERALPIMGIIEKTRKKLTNFVYKRKIEASSWKQPVGKRIDDILAANIKTGERTETMPCSTTGLFEIHEKHGNFAIDLTKKSCGCGKWEAIGLSCEHACAAIMRANLNVYDFVENCYHKETQCQIYSETLCPVPTYDMPSLGISSEKSSDENDDEPCPNEELLLPPRSKKPPGRPRRKRIESQRIERRPMQCSRCKKNGHNRKSCKEPLFG